MILGVIVCLVVTLVFQWILPAWWWVMAVPFLWCLWKEDRGWRGFLIGVSSAGLLWLGGSLYYLMTSGGPIAQRVAAMLQVDSPPLLLAVSVVIAAIAGGLAGCTGALLRAVLRPARR